MVGTLPLSLTYDLADAVVQSGLFSLIGVGSGSGSVAGPNFANPNDFTALTITTGTPGGNDLTTEQVPPDYLFGTIHTSLAFNAAGDVTNSSLTLLGVSEEAIISGTGTTASGFVGSDSGVCNTSAQSHICSVSGDWTHSPLPGSVPEPASVVLLGICVLALGFVRHGVRQVFGRAKT